MSNIEGGEFDCAIHDFKTNSVQEWDKHCYEEKHTVSVKQICEDCGNEIIEKIAYPKRFVEKSHQGKEVIHLECKECSAWTVAIFPLL